MRNYSEKMRRYSVPDERLQVIKAICRNPSKEECWWIAEAISKSCGDGLGEWILKGVREGYTWKQLQAEHIPCSRATYKVYRQRFYHALNGVLPKEREKE